MRLLSLPLQAMLLKYIGPEPLPKMALLKGTAPVVVDVLEINNVNDDVLFADLERGSPVVDIPQ